MLESGRPVHSAAVRPGANHVQRSTCLPQCLVQVICQEENLSEPSSCLQKKGDDNSSFPGSLWVLRVTPVVSLDLSTPAVGEAVLPGLGCNSVVCYRLAVHLGKLRHLVKYPVLICKTGTPVSKWLWGWNEVFHVNYIILVAVLFSSYGRGHWGWKQLYSFPMEERHVFRTKDGNPGSCMPALAFLIIMLNFPPPWSAVY